ncbi:MAG TPA: hypothetical protein DDY27_16130, partial [Hyphomonadaceae bacterium]|nr:hypothetical protein [Hyphomonadaceae bacterium]
TGNLGGVINGNMDAVVYGDVGGVINGDINGDIYGSFSGVVNGNVNGDIYGTFDGVLNGAFNGSLHNGTVTPPQEVTIEAADETAAEYLGRTYGGVSGYEEDPFSFDPKQDLHYHYTGMVASIENTISGLANYSSKLGSLAKAADIQNNFLQIKNDVLMKTKGSMVDADMARESARLSAIQTKEQLGVQALSIANQAPNMVLRLFG